MLLYDQKKIEITELLKSATVLEESWRSDGLVSVQYILVE